MTTWNMPLHRCPTVVSCGIVEHGQRPIDRWWLPRLWTLHWYHYHAELLLDGHLYQIQPGSVGVIAPGVQQEYRYGGRSRHLYAHLELPIDGPTVPVPILLPSMPHGDFFRQRFEQAIGDSMLHAQRGQVRMWDLLWELNRHADAQSGTINQRRLATVIASIEQGLDGSLSIPKLARSVGLSHNQLTRIVRAEWGTTVIGYIRRRRVERAVHLLRCTDLPLIAIAAQVGIPDAQAFCKTVTAVAGQSPSAIRGAQRISARSRRSRADLAP